MTHLAATLSSGSPIKTWLRDRSMSSLQSQSRGPEPAVY